jgi:tRNA pseudouridine55 synthase
VNGVLLVDKPAGPTSFAIVARIRRAIGRRAKVGHAGTLDPFATGLLLVLAGRATRIAPYLVGLDKRYRATLVLGVRSDTGDRDGVLEASDAPLPTRETLEAGAAALTGELDQVPPAASAVKVDGRRAYELARAGQTVVLEPRRVRVDRFDVLDYDPRAGRAEVEIACSKGTYVRSLARDLGEALGCGAHCDSLRRTAIGGFLVDDAGAPDDVAAALEDARWYRTPAAALGHLPSRELAADERTELSHGRGLALRGEQGATACVANGVLVAVAEPVGEQLRPRLVLEPAS